MVQMAEEILIETQPGRWTTRDFRFCARWTGKTYLVRDGKDNAVFHAVLLQEAERWMKERYQKQ